jgi:hypothetical protein
VTVPNTASSEKFEIETVICVGAPPLAKTLRFTFEADNPRKIGAAPLAGLGLEYTTMFWTAVVKAADGVELAESYGFRDA